MSRTNPMELELIQGTLLSSSAIELAEFSAVVEMNFSLSWLQFYALRCQTEEVERRSIS